MRFYAGIDGGQSSTVAVVADETGRVLGRGTSGPADEVAQDVTSTRLKDALGAALAGAMARAQLPAQTQFASVVAGISGYEGRIYGRPPQLPTEKLTLVHDTVVAHAGALRGDPGVIVIAGTGSVAYAVNEKGDAATIGGWGYLFGDEGSAFRLARDVVSDAMRDADAGEQNDLTQAALQHFRMPSLRKLARAFYAGEISRAEFASFAAGIVYQAERGNSRAAQYVKSTAGSLARLAMHAALHVGLQTPKVALIGGMFRSSTLRDATVQWMRDLVPRAQHVAAAYDPAVGALLLAYKARGVLPQSIVE